MILTTALTGGITKGKSKKDTPTLSSKFLKCSLLLSVKLGDLNEKGEIDVCKISENELEDWKKEFLEVTNSVDKIVVNMLGMLRKYSVEHADYFTPLEMEWCVEGEEGKKKFEKHMKKVFRINSTLKVLSTMKTHIINLENICNSALLEKEKLEMETIQETIEEMITLCDEIDMNVLILLVKDYDLMK